MDRQRFDHLLEAYGADFKRWPEAEREVGAAFAAAHPGDVSEALQAAVALDGALDARRVEPGAPELLAARILAAHKRQRTSGLDWRAVAALAACGVFGIVLGYSGGLMAPLAYEDEDYIASVFEAPFAGFEGDEG